MRSSSPRLSSRRARPRGGFTLLEVAIAMTFVALLAGGIVISISTCLNVWERSLETANLNQEARAVLEVASRDIRGAYLGLLGNAGFFTGMPAAAGDPPVDIIEVSTESSSPSRLALLPDERRPDDPRLRPPVTDYVAVRYDWRPGDGTTPAGLYRTTMVVPDATVPPLGALPQPTTSELISEAVALLEFRYFDGTQWVDQWDAPLRVDRLPAAVFIKLTVVDARERPHEFETIVPIPAR